MAKGRVTVGAVKGLTKADNDVFLWDDLRAGFGVKCTPAGKKVFLLQYRMAGRGSPTRRYTIGAYGPWTVDKAEKEASRLLLLIDQGIDPAADKRERKRRSVDLLFEKIADEYLAKRVKPVTSKSYEFTESILRLHITPVLKGKALPAITKGELLVMLNKLPVNSLALRRNVFAVVRAFFRWAKGEGHISANPVADMNAPPAVESRDRVLSVDEIRLAWRAMSALPYPFGPWQRLLLILGQRRNETAGLDWVELSRSAREWVVPGRRTKNGQTHIVPLSDLAVETIDTIAGGDNWPKRGPVFSTRKDTSISGFSKAKRLLDSKIAELIAADAAASGDEPHSMDAWRLHDLRRTAATHMQAQRIPSDWIEAVQNRLSGEGKKGSAKVYQRYTYQDEKREALQRWGEYLRSLVTEQRSNVVPLAVKAG